MFFHGWPFLAKKCSKEHGTKKTGGKAKLLQTRFIGAEPLRFFFVPGVPFLEAFNASGAVYELLFTGIKRMALVADINVRAFDRRSRFNHIAARTGERRRLIFRMDFFFHNRPLMKRNDT
jgi:hypothetical protein